MFFTARQGIGHGCGTDMGLRGRVLSHVLNPISFIINPGIYFFYLGKANKKIRLGYTAQEHSEKKLPGSISISIKNLDNLYENPFIRELFIQQIAKQYKLKVDTKDLLVQPSPATEELEIYMQLIGETTNYIKR